MRNTFKVLAFGAIWLAVAAAGGRVPVHQPTVETGLIANAPFRIDVPAKWNGRLIMLMHGYEPAGMPRHLPWPAAEETKLFVDAGYAVAQSGYRTQGWAVAEALPDIERLRDYFVKHHGRPKQTYAIGFSLGGLLALATVEREANSYAGALSLCGVNMSGDAVGGLLLRNLAAFDFYFPHVLPKLDAADAPALVGQDVIEAALDKDQDIASRLADALDIRRPALAGAIMLDYLVLQELRSHAGGFPADNQATLYTGFPDDEALNAGIARYRGSPKAIAYLAANAPLSGNIRVPVVLQSNADDPTIPPRYGSLYPAAVRRAGKQKLLTVLPRIGHGHCDFSADRTMAALAQLVEKTR